MEVVVGAWVVPYVVERTKGFVVRFATFYYVGRGHRPCLHLHLHLNVKSSSTSVNVSVHVFVAIMACCSFHDRLIKKPLSEYYSYLLSVQHAWQWQWQWQ